MKPLIAKLRIGIDLNAADVSAAVAKLLSEAVEDSVKVDFLTALHRKAETTEEIIHFVEKLASLSVDPLIDPKNLPGPMIDICGTGGDGVDLFNVSTTIMFILAAGGAVVTKHGNHAVTSRCGSADVLEALCAPIDLAPDDLRECAQELGLCFIHARHYHPAYRMIGELRTRLSLRNFRTIFSLLGPLMNPARPAHQLIGVFSPRLPGVIADVARRLGRERVWVVHGTTEKGPGIDDISVCGATLLAELVNGKVITGVIDPRWLNIPAAPLDELRGGDPKENAALLEGVLSGEIQTEKRDLTVVNAAAGFVIAGITHDMGEGIALAREQIDSGRALERLRRLQQFRARTKVGVELPTPTSQSAAQNRVRV